MLLCCNQRVSALLRTHPKISCPPVMFAAPVPAEHDNCDADERRATLSSVRDRHHLPALAVGCVRGRLDAESAATCCDVYVSGVRRMGHGTAALTSDRFILGSCTKAMTATVLAILIERGLLQWDTTLPVALPSLDGKLHPSYHTATLAMVCCHMAGLPRETGLGRLPELAAASVMAARRSAAAEVLSSPALSSPGSELSYSNVGYIVLGCVMEECTGRSWEDLMVDELFCPLGITRYGFGCPADLLRPDSPDQPWPHVWGETGVAVPIDPNVQAGANALWRAPAGAVNCSLDEWAKFAQLHIDGFHGHPTPILTPTSFAMLHRAPSEQTYTYGAWRRLHRGWAGGDTLSHTGSNHRGSATIWIAPCKSVAYVAATNVSHEGGGFKAMDAAIFSMIALDRRRDSE